MTIGRLPRDASAVVDRLAPHIGNVIAPVTAAFVTGIVGDQPSKYAKTPPLWNAVYRDLGWDAQSIAWDVTPAALPGFVGAVRQSPEIAGFNVTNPHKIAIASLLDDLDPLARQIGAVNTVVRSADGRLIGHNTDGQGTIDALTLTLPGMTSPFMSTLRGATVVLLGAGGAARAAAFYLGRAIGAGGRLRVVNRDGGRAAELAEAARSAYGVGEGGGEDRLLVWLEDADLVANATVKGQSGWRRHADGSASQLEIYSALGPANPGSVSADRALDAAAARDWFAASRSDLARHAAAALDALAAMPPAAACFDMIYAPLETRFLREARLAGHPTQNGKWMNVAQAADAFARRVCAPHLAAAGIPAEDGYRRAFEIMARVW
jgi:shikimate 5-dehydrogenase